MNRTFWVNVIEIIILTFNCIIFGARIVISLTALHHAISLDSIGNEFHSQLITLPDSTNIFCFDLDTFEKEESEATRTIWQLRAVSGLGFQLVISIEFSSIQSK